MQANSSPPNGHIADRRRIGCGIAFLLAFILADVVGVLLALLLPAVQAAREAARRGQCEDKLRRIASAMLEYQQANGRFPPAYIADKNGKPMHSWRVLILPYMAQQSLYSRYRFDEPWNGPHNAALAQLMPSIYACPSETSRGQAETSYAMIVGPHAISDGPTARRLKDITGGGSNTIMVAECAGAGINWMEPRDIDVRTMVNFADQSSPVKPSAPGINSAHADVANVAFCDGLVREISSKIDRKVLDQLLTIDKKPGMKASEP